MRRSRPVSITLAALAGVFVLSQAVSCKKSTEKFATVTSTGGTSLTDTSSGTGGGILPNYPLMRSTWVSTYGDLNLGLKWNLASEADKKPVAFALRGGKATFRFSTGTVADERLRVKVVLDETAGAPRADLDGALSFAGGRDAQRVSFEGAAIFSGADLAGWRMSGPVRIDAANASISALSASPCS